MVYCGVQGTKSGFYDTELGYPHFALQVVEVASVSFLFIINSTQIGLLCINMLGTSVMVLQLFSTQCSLTVTTDC